MVAEVFTLIREESLKSFPVYEVDKVVGEINWEDLNAFLNDNKEQGEIYAHKLNFDLGTVLVAIEHMHDERARSNKRDFIPHGWVLRISAVAILAIATIGVALIFFKPLASTSDVQPDPISSLYQVVLTFADGERIVLNESKGGIQLNGKSLVYNDGTVVNNKQWSNSWAKPNFGREQMVISTPNGGMYQVMLPDGTKVWLNAGSSMKFVPGVEGKGTRTVELAGEAYFEVAKMSNKVPFMVLSAGQQVEVLGTHFNVSAYKNDGVITTTLLEGSLAVTPVSKTLVKSESPDLLPLGAVDLAGGEIQRTEVKIGKTKLLKPNEQAVLKGMDLKVSQVDGKEVADWVKGEYVFRNMPLQSIMHIIERWYNVEVSYQHQQMATTLLGGTLSKSASLAEVLEMLKITANVNFVVDGKKITVIK